MMDADQIGVESVPTIQKIQFGSDALTLLNSFRKKPITHFCPHCSYKTSRRGGMRIHLKKHTDERPYECVICKKKYKLKHHLTQHVLTHSEFEHHKCTLCDYRTGSTVNMERHKIRKHPTELFENASGELSLPTAESENNNPDVINSFEEQGLNFSLPDTSTPTITSFQDSTASSVFHSNMETKKLTCKHCEIVFPDNVMYGLHIGCHSVANVYQCNICGLECRDKYDFMYHLTIGTHQS
uniref:Zinc finger protein Pegasus n=1 Tax=Phallusia mammillata TaxID=59560 RepID=A0A6F9DFZ0_9ASCI|nr:zinc finger protein Pegasus [Phallusia mammillata]